MRHSSAAIFSIALALITGCSTTLKSRPPDATGKFATSFQLDDGGVLVEKPFADKFKALAYVRADAHETSRYMRFWVESIRKTGAFTNVLQKPEIETLVIDRKLTGKVSNISDLIGLHQLAEQIGSFLIIEPVVMYKGGYNYGATLKAIDAESGETVLHLQQKAFNWSGLDDPLLYPLLNAFVQWTKGQTISTKSHK